MKLVERSFRLEAPEGLGGRPRPELIGPVLASLHDTLQDSVRMGFLHSSRARGRISAELMAAAAVRYIGHSADGENATLLRFEVAPFGSVASELFQQKLLWDDGPQRHQTAFELLGSALIDIATKREESNRFDSGLLRRIARYKRSLDVGVSCIGMPDTDRTSRGRIDRQVLTAASELLEVTPAPQRVRVAGRLDLMGASQAVLKLVVRPGEIVTAIWDGTATVESFRDLFNRDVILEGQAVFRPSGSLLRIDADAIALGSANADFFRHVPSGAVRSDYQRLARLKAGDKSTYAQILGSIPAGETDEAFVAAIEDLS